MHEFTVHTGDFAGTNTVTDSTRLRPAARSAASVDDDSLTATLPPVSWNVLRLRPAGRD